ncbi:glycosyl transferase [Pelistega indica]|uniref:Glycosyl transferase n=1 Tax=Pelistega indica TaxID=1414851 RepID=V8G9M3_9BURK|nr:glycosyltransferase family 2 protein [Pelistega indica]ETD72638.1 glycosyl transferase [Pelistega indica]
MNDIVVSIIVPAYNAEKTLEKTLLSIQRQQHKNVEVLIVNDCSTDKTIEVAERFCLADSRFFLFNQEKNAGVAAARNRGIKEASGEYVCFLDADDWWGEDKLTDQLAFMQTNNVALSYMPYVRIQEYTGNQLSIVNPPAKLTFNDLLKSNYIGNLTAMVTRTAIGDTRFQKIGHEDYVFWLEILRKNIVAFCVPGNSVKCFYLVRKNSLSSSKFKMITWQWKIYRNYLKLSYHKSFIFLICYIVQGIRKRA